VFSKVLRAFWAIVLGIAWTLLVIFILWAAWLFIFMPFGRPDQPQPAWRLLSLGLVAFIIWITPLALFIRKRAKGN
jgi:hypothetical protein